MTVRREDNTDLNDVVELLQQDDFGDMQKELQEIMLEGRAVAEGVTDHVAFIKGQMSALAGIEQVFGAIPQFFRVAIIARIHHRKLWIKTGHKNFVDCVEKVLGLKHSQGYDILKIHDSFGIPWLRGMAKMGLTIEEFKMLALLPPPIKDRMVHGRAIDLGGVTYKIDELSRHEFLRIVQRLAEELDNTEGQRDKLAKRIEKLEKQATPKPLPEKQKVTKFESATMDATKAIAAVAHFRVYVPTNEEIDFAQQRLTECMRTLRENAQAWRERNDRQPETTQEENNRE